MGVLLTRFEKSLFDLIRGLRARKGDERAYILENLKECRKEVRSQDGGCTHTQISHYPPCFPRLLGFHRGADGWLEHIADIVWIHVRH